MLLFFVLFGGRGVQQFLTGWFIRFGFTVFLRKLRRMCGQMVDLRRLHIGVTEHGLDIRVSVAMVWWATAALANLSGIDRNAHEVGEMIE